MSLREIFIAGAQVVAICFLSFEIQAQDFASRSIPMPTASEHPRLWVRKSDLTRIRSYAVSTNPVYLELKSTAQTMLADVNNGIVPGTCVDANNDQTPDRSWDKGTQVFDSGHYLTEIYAQLFAFMSLIENNAQTRAMYQQKAHDLIMTMINQASLGTYNEKTECLDEGYQKYSCYCRSKRRFRDSLSAGSEYTSHFLLGDRGFVFDAVPTAIDWVYHTFSAAEKAKIRKAFLIWIGDFLRAEFYYAPRPINMVYNPALLHLEDPYLFQLRFATNNHYLSYMRGVGLMSLTLDAADDAGAVDRYGNSVRSYLANAIGSWLYVSDYGRRYDTPGGLSPEGSQYSDLGFKFEMQFRLALASSREISATKWGNQVNIYEHPFWDRAVPAYFHNIPPAPTIIYDYMGPTYEPAWYGDGERMWQTDVTGAFGSLALHDLYMGKTDARPGVIRWMLKNTSPGGKDKFLDRLHSSLSNIKIREAIVSYLLFTPSAPEISDPRPAFQKELYDAGLGRILARTSWDSSARFIAYKLGFNRIDHNHGDANSITFWRKGEWLTKKWVGYGPRVSLSDYNNTLSVQNHCNSASGSYDTSAYNYEDWRQGSQMRMGAGSQAAYNAHSAANWKATPMDPKILAKSVVPGRHYISATGDSTILYNHWNEWDAAETCENVTHVSRSFVWLKPDHIVVYDRAKSNNNGFKRFWLSLPTQPTITRQGNAFLSVANSLDGAQKLAIRTVLPVADAVSVTKNNTRPVSYGDETAEGEGMSWRIKAEALNSPKETRFLHVLQGLDAGVSIDQASLLRSHSGNTYEGVALKDTAIMFRKTFGSFSFTRYRFPSTVKKHIVTGLARQANYTVVIADGVVSITPGGTLKSDDGGVLNF